MIDDVTVGAAFDDLELAPRTGARIFKGHGRLLETFARAKHAFQLDEALRGLLGNRIYGCDDCLAACPWNKFAVDAREIGYAVRVGAPPLAALAGLDDAAFRVQFAGSPIKRIGRDRFVRNVLYAIGNSGEAGLRPVAAALREDPDPAVADAARWAMARLE